MKVFPTVRGVVPCLGELLRCRLFVTAAKGLLAEGHRRAVRGRDGRPHEHAERPADGLHSRQVLPRRHCPHGARDRSRTTSAVGQHRRLRSRAVVLVGLMRVPQTRQLADFTPQRIGEGASGVLVARSRDTARLRHFVERVVVSAEEEEIEMVGVPAFVPRAARTAAAFTQKPPLWAFGIVVASSVGQGSATWQNIIVAQ